MSGEVGLLDTGTVILLPRLRDPSILPRSSLISVVTLAEAERVSRQAELQEAEATFETLPFDSDAARAFARVASSLRRSGRKAASRTYDAMIAAVAIANELPLYACNPEDFAGIDDLIVIAVPHPDGARP